VSPVITTMSGVATKAFIAIGLGLLFVQPIAGHTVKHGDALINYEKLRGGNDGKTNCCDQSHCQPASTWSHDKKSHVWKFTVKLGTANAEVEVPDSEVTLEDVEHKGLAHWCGEFVGGENIYYSTRCAFVPLKLSLNSALLLDASALVR
jgi:hypothetical protein